MLFFANVLLDVIFRKETFDCKRLFFFRLNHDMVKDALFFVSFLGEVPVCDHLMLSCYYQNFYRSVAKA